MNILCIASDSEKQKNHKFLINYYSETPVVPKTTFMCFFLKIYVKTHVFHMISLSMKWGLHGNTFFPSNFRCMCFPKVTWCQYVNIYFIFFPEEGQDHFFPLSYSFLSIFLFHPRQPCFCPQRYTDFEKAKRNILQRTRITFIAFVFLIMYR